MSTPTRNLAVVYEGPNKVSVKDIGYPQFKDPQGKPAPHAVIVKSIVTNICGSDLHMYRGRTTYPPGMAFGHEITGEIVEKGSSVHTLSVGDWISVPFNISCGTCVNCKSRKTSACQKVNPKMAGGAYGFADMGNWQGGQAEYVLVPYADFDALVLPKEQARQKILDLAMLSDILPTGFNGAVQAGVTVGRSVYVAGAGPVGICAAASAVLLGASVVVVGDPNPVRLTNAAKLGPAVKTLDLSKIGSKPEDLTAAIKALIGDEDVECAIDACGFEATEHGSTVPNGTENSAVILNCCFDVLAAGGGIGIPGIYPPADPQGKTAQAKEGLLPIAFGAAWNKAITIQMGQCPVMKYHRELMNSILHSRIKVSDALNVQVISLQEAPAAYEKFNKGEPVKYVLDPHGYLSNGVIAGGVSASNGVHDRTTPGAQQEQPTKMT